MIKIKLSEGRYYTTKNGFIVGPLTIDKHRRKLGPKFSSRNVFSVIHFVNGQINNSIMLIYRDDGIVLNHKNHEDYDILYEIEEKHADFILEEGKSYKTRGEHEIYGPMKKTIINGNILFYAEYYDMYELRDGIKKIQKKYFTKHGMHLYFKGNTVLITGHRYDDLYYPAIEKTEQQKSLVLIEGAFYKNKRGDIVGPLTLVKSIHHDNIHLYWTTAFENDERKTHYFCHSGLSYEFDDLSLVEMVDHTKNENSNKSTAITYALFINKNNKQKKIQMTFKHGSEYDSFIKWAKSKEWFIKAEKENIKEFTTGSAIDYVRQFLKK